MFYRFETKKERRRTRKISENAVIKEKEVPACIRRNERKTRQTLSKGTKSNFQTNLNLQKKKVFMRTSIAVEKTQYNFVADLEMPDHSHFHFDYGHLSARHIKFKK